MKNWCFVTNISLYLTGWYITPLGALSGFWYTRIVVGHFRYVWYSIYVSGLEKQTSIMFEFYFRFRFRPYHCIGDVILHQAVEFHPNRTIFVSYDVISIFKMADAEAQFYFRFRISWRPSHRKVNVYQQTKFRSRSSIHVWVITISCLEKQTSAILEFFFRLLFRPCYSASGYQISSKSGRPLRSNDQWRFWGFHFFWGGGEHWSDDTFIWGEHTTNTFMLNYRVYNRLYQIINT